MTHAFVDTGVRGAWFEADRRPRRRVAPTVLTVRWLALAIIGLVVTALGGLVVTPSASSAAAAATATGSTVAASGPLELHCAPTHVGNQARFAAGFALSGVTANTVQWQID